MPLPANIHEGSHIPCTVLGTEYNTINKMCFQSSEGDTE